jgi:hypothetical protein
MNKKRFLIMFSVLVVIGLVISTYQYVETMKTDVVSAAQTIPNPGHSWSSMESGPDSIQVTGRTITNLDIPVNSSDAATKSYVDAAGSSLYTSCYVLSSATSGLTCSSGYTTILTTTNGCWVGQSQYANATSVGFSMGGTYVVSAGWALDCNMVYISTHSEFKGGCASQAYCTTGGWGPRCCAAFQINGTYVVAQSVYSSSPTFSLCCK